MTDDQMSTDVSNDDKLWAALAYLFSPLVPIIILLLEDKKDRPFIRANNAQALVWGVALFLISTLSLPLFGLGFCVGILGFFLQLYWAFQAYQGQMINIPVITDFVKNQGWA